MEAYLYLFVLKYFIELQLDTFNIYIYIILHIIIDNNR